MRLVTAALLLLTLPLLAGEEKPAANVGPVTKIDSGLISGQYVGEKKDVRAFLGIPFAAPPVGDLRWRPPAPAAPWEGMRECRDFGPACLQPSGFGRSGGHTGNQSEDCLYLNVWAPRPSKITEEKYPVMVWIHGGGMTIGSGSLPFYRGEEFARRGVVLVTINYRLGPFGFFGHPALSAESDKKVSGNYGLLDQIAALRWVKRNAATFGGDPDCVTIFGESAGAVSVCCLMVSPLAKGLFHRAISQSGTAVGVKTPLRSEDPGETLESRGVALAKQMGVGDEEDVAAALRALSGKKIMAIAKPAPVTPHRAHRYFPVVDGHVLPEEPSLTWEAGGQHDVPLMIGANADDGSVFATRLPVRSVHRYGTLVKAFYGEHAEDILKAFPAKSNQTAARAARDLMTVAFFVAPARRLAMSMEEKESEAFSYHFTRVSPRAKKYGAGAAHGFEIPYVFGNLYAWLGANAVDAKLSRVMQDAWIRFARTGNPNGEGLPEWPAYTKKNDTHLEFGDEVRTGTGLLKQKCDLFDEIDAAKK